MYCTVQYYTILYWTILYSTVLYYTMLYCTICIITLDSEGFLHKHATSSQLLHTVTLDTADSHHKSNYLRCYCLTVSFKINKSFSGSARARARTHTHTHTHTHTYCCSSNYLPHGCRRSCAVTAQSGRYSTTLLTHTTPYRYALCWSKLHTHFHFSYTTFSYSWTSTP